MGTSNRMNKGFKIFILIFATLSLIGFINRDKIVESLNSISGKGLQIVLKNQYIGSNILYFDDSIIMVKDYSISFLDNDGKVKMTKDFGSSDIDVRLEKEHIYSIDKKTGDIYMLSSQGESVNRFQTKSNVFAIKEIDNGLLSHSKDEDMETISLIDKNGEIRKLYSIKEGNILTYNLSDDGKFVVSTLGQSGPEIISLLEVIYEGKNELKREFKNELVLSTEFISDKLIVLTDTRLLLLKSGEEIFNKEIMNIRDIYLDGELIYILSEKDLVVYDLEGNIVSKISNNGFTTITKAEDYIVLYGQNKLAILQNQVKIVEYNTDADIQYLSGSSDMLAITMDEKMEIYKLIIN